MGAAVPEKVRARLDKARNIWVSTVRPDGRPHLVPVWFVSRDRHLYICISPASVKAQNLAARPRIALALEDGSHPVICEGEARFVERPWPDDVAAAFQSKYDWEIATDGVYTALVEITPRKWLNW